MKKHTRSKSEIRFAEGLEEGEVFAISSSTFVPTIISTLKTQKDLSVVRIPVRELSPKERKHFDVYRVVPDRDPTPLEERRFQRNEALKAGTYSPYLSRQDAALIGYEEQWLADWEKRHGTETSE